MYLEILDLEVANTVSIEINQFTRLLKNVPVLPMEVIEEGGKYYVKVNELYDYSAHDVNAVLNKLPSESTIEVVTGVLRNASDFGANLKKTFTAENIATGISQTPGAVSRVIEAMNKKYPLNGCIADGVSFNDILTTNSLSIAPECIDLMLQDLSDNPDDFAPILTWINPERLTKYKNDIIAYLQS